ncbi:hypothetical protein P152DRAFT_395639 [Eremomyces bilateralis CBS 781.70]|uniref:C2H2-type domain-containing protein n=1 Tax=Eremomyces bilateralis CBS 781.70 TaxID=1392243 RepID=A0A6G1G5M9_9PEZI|nr:uncharacterized protein P152DRAFT_395639 [Eremomyces bilateralis CBS 781.70]KAF1813312.1 hypothetical protein P152DRAFT_395639 [Eremomyces bilateralis CBS 781.70]
MDESGLPVSPTTSHDDTRGRRRDRAGSDDGNGDGDSNGTGPGSAEHPGSSKKRRRSRKGLDKKFECPHEGCGKSYSRAEHLYRHQLNHNPKQIYHCDFPECNRSFVRQDLCARHKERHTARGSQLLRKDTYMTNTNANHIVNSALNPNFQNNSSYPGAQSQRLVERPFITPSPVLAATTFAPHSASPRDHSLPSPSFEAATLSSRSRSDESYRMFDAGPRAIPAQSFPSPQRQTSFGSGGYGQFAGSQLNPPLTPTSTTNLPALSLNSPYNSASGQSQPSNAMETEYNPMNQVSETLMENIPNYAMPVFGGDGYSRSPFAMADDFAAWLFNNDSTVNPGVSPMGYSGGVSGMMAQTPVGFQAPYFSYDPTVSGWNSQPAPPTHPMAVNSILDTNMAQSLLSEERRLLLIDYIDQHFVHGGRLMKAKRDEILEGNRDDDNHLLSLRMMQKYISSFWDHIHGQMPILHKPTFSANQCSELLLLCIMALGASCLDKRYGMSMTTNCAELSNFLAWHLRWEIFMHEDFRPPAKLYVFQALLLLETFEKMFSDRALHERAHIHHATTLTLMRRGSSLIGRPASDSPPSVKDPKTEGRKSHANVSGTNTPDDWWNKWISNEATRRVAFAAFVMDSIHATMFGHSAVMVAHEMRLPLPCDETMWSATNGADVARMDQDLTRKGIKSITFLEGLKKTLNGQAVRTNSFGRTILMAGLLSVSWHMNQRDLQVSSLGGAHALGGRDKWRGALTRAFDYWKQDFDTALAKTSELAPTTSTSAFFNNNPPAPSAPSPSPSTSSEHGDYVFESRIVLHHLAHMATHVDIVDCQIFAGATRLLGRSITPQDYAGAQRRMKEGWAPSARARDATFYALRFLTQVLVPEEVSSGGFGGAPEFTYSARDDVLLNRPWVLYFAMLIVWSYGFALDGAIRPLYGLGSHGEQVRDMQGFLRRVGGVRAPDDLATVANRNACLGMLILLRDMFRQARWTLLWEASNLLGNCVEKLTGERA